MVCYTETTERTPTDDRDDNTQRSHSLPTIWFPSHSLWPKQLAQSTCRQWSHHYNIIYMDRTARWLQGNTGEYNGGDSVMVWGSQWGSFFLWSQNRCSYQYHWGSSQCKPSKIYTWCSHYAFPLWVLSSGKVSFFFT